nr:MAG TPA: hypothetical protein [Caudoviricetes sp.]
MKGFIFFFHYYITFILCKYIIITDTFWIKISLTQN